MVVLEGMLLVRMKVGVEGKGRRRWLRGLVVEGEGEEGHQQAGEVAVEEEHQQAGEVVEEEHCLKVQDGVEGEGDH